MDRRRSAGECVGLLALSPVSIHTFTPAVLRSASSSGTPS